MLPQRPNRIGEILLKNGVIDGMQLRAAMAHIERWGGRIASVLVETGLADEDRVVNGLARALGLERIHLANFSNHAQAPGIDATFAEEKVIFPAYYEGDGKLLVVAVADPMDLPTIDEIQRRTRARVVSQIASEREIKSAIARVMARSIAPAPAVPLPEPAAGEATSVSSEAQLQSTQPPTGLSEEDLQRLQALQINQEKSARILRAVMQLLVEKGYLTPQELDGHFDPP